MHPHASGGVERVADLGRRLDRVELRAVPHHSVQRVALGREPHPRSGDAVDRAAVQLRAAIARGLLAMSRPFEPREISKRRPNASKRSCCSGAAGSCAGRCRPQRAGRAAARNRECEPRARRRSRPPRTARAPRLRRPTARRALRAGDLANAMLPPQETCRLFVTGAGAPQGSGASFADFREAVPRVSEFFATLPAGLAYI